MNQPHSTARQATRRVPDPQPRYRIEVRSIADGREQVTRTFAYRHLGDAERDYAHIRDLGGRAYSSGRYRLVLLDTQNHTTDAAAVLRRAPEEGQP
jgi:hypothetical protein